LPTAEKTNDSQKCGLSYFLSFVHFCSHFSENAKAPATPVFLVSNTQKVLIFQWVQGIVTTVYCFDVTPKWNSFGITRNHVSTLEVQTAEKPVTMRVCGQVQIVNWGLFYPVVLPNFHGLNFAGKWL